MIVTNPRLMRLYTKLFKTYHQFTKSGIFLGNSTIIHPSANIFNSGKGITIGGNGYLNFHSYIKCYNDSIVIGDDFSMQPFSIIYGIGPIIIGHGVRVAAQVTIVSGDHEMHRDKPIYQQGMRSKGITIEDDVWIGTGAKVLDGAYIAKGCVIGANAIVKGRTEPYGVYAGVPARRLKDR